MRALFSMIGFIHLVFNPVCSTPAEDLKGVLWRPGRPGPTAALWLEEFPEVQRPSLDGEGPAVFVS
jgi:hypothetical protein